MNDPAEIKKLIEEAEAITIWGHGLPDGDCYGCQMGLKNLIKENFPDKRVYAIGSGLPAFFPMMGAMDDPTDEEIKASLGILVDVSCLRRVEDQRVMLCNDYCKFDHHTPNPGSEDFPFPCLVEPERVSCAEVIADYALSLGWHIGKEAAGPLYLGMATDSGKFVFPGTTKRTFELAAKLIESGADPKRILGLAFYESDEVKAYKSVMRENTKFRDGVSYCEMRPEQYEEFGLSFKDAGDLCNAISSVHKCNIYVLSTFDRNGTIRVEMRSNRGYPVVDAAKSFGGGGHRFAAGINYPPAKDYDLMAIVDACSHVKPYN